MYRLAQNSKLQVRTLMSQICVEVVWTSWAWKSDSDRFNFSLSFDIRPKRYEGVQTAVRIRKVKMLPTPIFFSEPCQYMTMWFWPTSWHVPSQSSSSPFHLEMRLGLILYSFRLGYIWILCACYYIFNPFSFQSNLF